MKTKVCIKNCDSYDLDAVYSALEDAFKKMGGIEKIVKPKDKVLLKVNLIGAWPPEKSITTHPVVVEAIAKHVIRVGGIPWVGDSSGGSSYSLTENALLKSGIAQCAERAGITIKNFDKHKVEEIHVDDSDLLSSIQVAKPILDADVVISVPKLKTHGGTVITGGIKNMFGVVPGPKKAHLHKKFSDTYLFAEALVDIYATVKPDLCIMDGIIGMEGNGPSAGKSKKSGVIIVSEDSVAVDTVFCKLCDIDTNIVDTIQIAKRKAIGTTSMDEIEIVGDSIKEAHIENFKLPISVEILRNRYIPNWFKNFFRYKVNAMTAPKPVLMSEKCKQCNLCLKSCPMTAITLKNKYPEIDNGKCTSCFCCHELCPESAFDIKVHKFWQLMKI